MSIRLNDGSQFRIINQQNQDITTEANPQQTGLRLQIDTDHDGNFEGPADRTIAKPDQLATLLDSTAKASDAIKNIPFIDEIQTHLSKVKEIQSLLKEAGEYGHKADQTSAVWHTDEKIQLGKAAVQRTKAAYELDSANPLARFAFGMTVFRIGDSFWKDKAQKAMGLKVETEAVKLIGELEKDKFDILGQILLGHLYALANQNDKLPAHQAYLDRQAKTSPAEYAKAKAIFDDAMAE